MENRFPCAKCGDCCKRLGDGDWIGLSLFPWEIHLFPKGSIKPNLGLGASPDDPDFKTVLYLYDSSACIHLDDGWCLIHDLRPVVCMSYPFRMAIKGKGNMIYEVAPECTTIKLWPVKQTIAERYDEMDAAELIGDHLHRFYKSDQLKWRHQKGRWDQIGKG